MRKIISVIYLLCFFSFINTMMAQVTFTASSPTANCDDASFCVDITVTNFDSITSFQHVYDWDTTIMQLTTFTDLMPAGIGISPNMDSTDVGRGPYSWIDLSFPAVGITLADGVSIAQLCFTPNNLGTGDVAMVGSNTTLLQVNGIVNGVNTPDLPAVYNSGTTTIQDIENPVITCPANMTFESNGMNVPGIAPTSFSDNCNISSVIWDMSMGGSSIGTGNDDASGQFFSLGTTTVTYTITDEAGNTDDCAFDVTLTAAPADTGSLQFIPRVNFDCDGGSVTIEMLVTNFDSITGIQYGIQWDTAVLTHLNTMNTSLPPAASFNTANDSALLFLWFPFSGNPTTLSDSTVIFTMNFDLNGNFETPLLSFVSFPGIPIGVGQIQGGTDVPLPQDVEFFFMPEIVNVIDNTAPTVANCPTNISVFNDPDSCNAVVNWTAPTFTDNCGIDTIAVSNMPGETFTVGTHTITYTATDIGGNTEICTFDITVTDNEDPVITCPGNVTVDVITGTCANNTVNIGTATATDNCGIASITNDAPASYPVGMTTVTWTATDVNGLTATCTQIITIEDNELPAITCPGNITQCPGTTVTLGTPTTSDNCGVASVTNDAPATFPGGLTIVTWTVTDDNGNVNTCTQNVALIDAELPMITCPGDINQCPGTTVTLGTPTTSDNCGVASVTNDAPVTFPNGTTTVTWTVTDVAGNINTCTQSVTLIDTELPMITCPGDINQCPGTTVTLGSPTTSDNCGVASVTNDAPVTFPNGTTIVTWTVTDVTGNINTCTQSVTLTDTEIPMITCPADINQCPGTTITLGTPTTSDNCGVASVTNNAPATFPIGTTIVTWTVTNVAGNTNTCDQTVTIQDNQVPSITCPLTDAIDAVAGTCSAVYSNNLSPIVSDNCDMDLTVTYTINIGGVITNGTDDATGETFTVGSSTLTYYAEDDNGNIDSCSVIVQVNDNELPVLNCPGDTTLFAGPGLVDTLVNDIGLTSSDNCGIASITFEYAGELTGSGLGTDASGTFFPPGTTTVTYYVTDVNGNLDSCSFDVNIQVVTNELIACQPDQVEPNDADLCSAVVNGIAPTFLVPATDIAGVTYTLTGATSGTGNDDASGLTYNEGTTTLEYIATDIFGNMDTCSLDITVNDVQLPVWANCPTDINISTNLVDDCAAEVSWTAPSASDNCGVEQIIISHMPGDTFPIGTTPVSYVAIDTAGNIGTCTFNVIVEDNTLPEANCPGNITVNAAAGDCDAIVTWAPVTGSDACSAVNISCTSMSGDVFPVGTTTVVCTVSDNNGNSSMCNFDVTVLDDTAPIPQNCPADIDIAPNLPNCEAVVNWTPPTFVDCPPVNVTCTHNPGDIFPLGTTIVICIAIDPAGNDTTCIFEVNVIDDEAPVVVCPADVVVNSLAKDCGAFVNWPAPTATDNCDTNLPISTVPPVGTFFPVGTTTVTATTQDDAGNIGTCTFDVIVNDVFAPVFTCPGDITINLDGTITGDDTGFITSANPNGSCDMDSIFYNTPFVSDNCGIASVSLTSGIASGQPFPIGTTTLIFTAFDDSNNFATCEINITVEGIPTVGVLAMPDVVCEGQDVQFITDVTTVGATFEWNGPNGAFTPPLLGATTADAGIYSVTVTYPSGCTSTGSDELIVNTAAAVSASYNDPICNGEDIELDVEIPAGSNPSYEWSGPDNFSSQIKAPVVANPTAINTGIYTVTVTYSTGCVATSSVNVLFTSLPSPEIDLDCEIDLCLGSSCILTGTEYVPAPDAYIWTSQSGAGLPANTNDNQIVVTPTEAGTYIYNYSVSLGDCVSDTATQVVTVHGAPEAIDDVYDITFQNPQEVNVTSNDVFNANIGVSINIITPPTDGTIEVNETTNVLTYTPNSGFIGTDQLVYQICYNCGPELCSNAIVTFNVVDNRDCIYPTVITPNGDGVNDELYINCLEGGAFTNNEIVIYNIWGDQVFNAAPYQNNWDGTQDGEDLPDGTYYYIFRLDSNAELVKTFIRVFR